MKIILSRKGFDSENGSVASPIISGRPVSLPIPTGDYPSETKYRDLDLGAYAEKSGKSNCRADSYCHYDPMFEKERCAFGQSGQMQEGHLRKECVGEGDVFLFFGWFANRDEGDHHRIFGYLKVEKVNLLGANPSEDDQPTGFSERHPHTIPDKCWENKAKGYNTLYVGEGCTANTVHKSLRLTEPNNPNKSIWRVPRWLHDAKLTYHMRLQSRWEPLENPEFMRLQSVYKGQDFVANLANLSDDDREKAHKWLEEILAAIKDG